jgi:histidinol phosphatase-like PHP family hydrolase
VPAPDIAKLLAEYGRRTALAGGNPYRAKAYLRAAQSLAVLPEALDRIIADDRLREIPGVGDAIADIVTKLHRTGTHPSLERMRTEIPESVLEMLSIPGLRPDKVIKLYRDLGIASLAELEAAARDNRIRSVKGLGPALQRKILQGLELRNATLGSRHVHRAAEIIATAEKHLQRAFPGLQRIVAAGDVRRGGEIALARKRRMPKLVKIEDIRGILHAHSDASDGVHTLQQMAEATRKRGYQYFGVADHSKSAHYAGGLSLAEIEEQHAEIDRLNAGLDGHFRIFKGIESDILSDGSLDYPDDVLRRFDFIVASIHGQFRKDRESQTERLLRAVANPFVTILGHMTGRQLLRRPGYDIDVEQVLMACAKHGVAIEINANPWRLDLDWRWHRHALKLGCIFSINPDAHSTAEIDLMRWGIAMARKGGVSADQVLNTLDLHKFSRWLEGRKQRRSRVRSRPPMSARAGGSRPQGTRLARKAFFVGQRRPAHDENPNSCRWRAVCQQHGFRSVAHTRFA